ncbi:DUF4173 domain-containing protein [Erythrobacter sp. SDW2]|uniref:DUF4153 domain-containing protein n=1 Tax=Erythrobacter sp. SDW2 TaxID=2907154 RepID=UPI001F1B89C2|nr:DUF4173 domain-containing protein [Erythrobacter sp. SDW2]UIP06687.1 DUF4173 domain-containing protein [Erythrobacter sp. SDW2]
MTTFLQRPRGTIRLKTALTIAVIAVGDIALFQHELFPAGLGFLGLALVGALAIGQPSVLRDRRALFALVLAAAYAFAMIYDASLLAFLLFGVALGMALLLPRTGVFDDGWRWFQRLFAHGFISVFGPVLDAIRISRLGRRRHARSSGWRRTVQALALPIVGSLVFLWLFALANPVLDGWIASLALPEPDEDFIVRMFLWVVTAWISWGVLRPRMVRLILGTFDGSGDPALPGFTTASILISLFAFNAVFLLQNAMDAAWLWGFVALPDGMTLAEYAHRGAYPLVVTALLTALFVLVALRPGSTTAAQPLVRRLVVVWIGQNLFLVFNAALRTVDYVEAYSLTVLRISALLWMVLVAIGLVLVMWRMLAGKSSGWLINTNLAAAGMMLSGVCFVDLGAVAAQWNVRHAREAGGKGAQLDLCYLTFQDGTSLLPLIELERQKIGGAFAERVNNARRQVHFRLIDRMNDGGWQILDAHRLDKAAELLGGDIGPRPQGRGYNCDGNELPPEPDHGDGDAAGTAKAVELAPPAFAHAALPTLTQSRER